MLSLRTLRVAEAAARFLPMPIAAPAARAAGRTYGRISSDERLIVERNLRRVYGDTEFDVDRSVDEVFESYARYWLDSLRLPHLSPEQIDRGFSYEGMEHAFGPLESGGTPIFALPHVGNWEWAAAWMTMVKGFAVTSVAERLDDDAVFAWFVDYRTKLGMDIVPLGPSAATELAKAVEPGRMVSLVTDRDLTGDGIEVDFFGERTRMPGGPALLALRTGSPLLPGAVYLTEGRCHGVVMAPLDTERRGRLREDVSRVTQDLALAFEELIRRAPEQWHLLQPNWPSDFEALGRPVPGADTGTGTGTLAPG